MNQVQEPAMQPDAESIVPELSGEWLLWWNSRTRSQKIMPIAILAGFWGLHASLGGFRSDHLAVALLAVLYYAGPRTHSLYHFFLPFTLYIVIYDSQGYYADLIRGDVRVMEPYQFDNKFFGIETSEGRLLPTQWFQRNTHQALDIVTSLAYILFIPVFLIVALFFRFRLPQIKSNSLSREYIQIKTHGLMWGMFWLNLLCCSTYYWYPAAPPWYVDLYGFGPVQLDTPPNAAGALRFDELFGVNLFKEFYAKCPNVFGAIPSGHVAFPLLCMYFAFKLKSLRVFCSLFFLLIAFSAVYLNHHYILDILWGVAYGLLVGWSMDTYFRSPSTTQPTS